jgi:hypothetical protein
VKPNERLLLLAARSLRDEGDADACLNLLSIYARGTDPDGDDLWDALIAEYGEETLLQTPVCQQCGGTFEDGEEETAYCGLYHVDCLDIHCLNGCQPCRKESEDTDESPVRRRVRAASKGDLSMRDVAPGRSRHRINKWRRIQAAIRRGVARGRGTSDPRLSPNESCRRSLRPDGRSSSL